MLSISTHDPNQEFSIFDNTPFPMWIFDLETYSFLKVNKEAIRQYGYSEEEFLNMTIRDIRPKEDIGILEKAVKEALEQREWYTESLFRHKKKDGTIIYVQIKSNLVTYQGKEADLVTAIDLTQRYERERKIEAQKEYLKAIGAINQLLLKSTEWLQSLNECFKIVGETIDVDRIYFFQNNAQEQVSSQRLEWARDRIKPQIDNPELQDIPFSRFPLFIEPLKKQRHFEAIVKDLPPSPTKETLSQQEIKSILVLPLWVNNDFCGFIGFDDCKQERTFSEDEFQLLHSLTSNLGHVIKQQNAYQELSFSEGRFKSLIENGRDLIAIIDEQGNYKYVAATSKNVLGIPAEEFLGKNAFNFIYEEDVPRLKKQLGEIRRSGSISMEPYRFPDAEGSWRWVKTELTNHLQTPLIEGIIANTHEVTHEVEQKMVDDLFATLTLALGQPDSLSSCLDEALDSLVKLSKISVSEIWLVSPDDSQLNLASKACLSDKFNVFYQSSKDKTSFKNTEGLPGMVWKEKKPITWTTLYHNKHFVRSHAAKLANLSTGIGLPIMHTDQFLGCIVCYSEFSLDQLSEQVNLLTEVCEKLGAIVKQRITEEEYRTFFNTSPDPYCIIGYDGHIKRCNKAFVKLTGCPEKDLDSSSIFHFIHKEDREKSKEKLESLIYGELREPYKVRFATADGEVRWLLCSGTVVSESKTVIAVGKDITEQTLAEEELHTAYKRLKTAQKIAKLGYWSRELDSDVSVWSDETYRIYECSPQTFTPTMENVIRTFHPDDRYLIDSNPAEHLEPGKVQSFEHKIITTLDKVKWVRQEIRLVADESGAPTRIEGTIQDITERIEYEEQLAFSNERFKLAMKASSEMIWEIDHLKQKVSRGKGYESVIKYNRSEDFTLANSWFKKIHPQDRDEVWNSLNKALKDKRRKSWRAEYRMQSASGTVNYFIDRCHILRDDEGNPIRSVGSALDVTVSRRQLERIKQQNANLREIAWLQSHVIRAPLSRIMGLVYLANKLGGGGKSTAEIMQLITESAHELDEVIHEITNKTNAIKEEDDRSYSDR